MTQLFNDSWLTAFMLWAFDAPPIGRPGREVGAVRIGPPGDLPAVIVDGVLCPVAGITPSGWLAAAGCGWRRFTGDPSVIPRIASACNTAQCLLLNDRARFEAALSRHMARSDHSHVGGLPVIILEDGCRSVRLADITVPEVRRGVQAMLDRLGPDQRIDPEDEPRLNPLPPGLLDAELWWRFCRNWAKQLR